MCETSLISCPISLRNVCGNLRTDMEQVKASVMSGTDILDTSSTICLIPGPYATTCAKGHESLSFGCDGVAFVSSDPGMGCEFDVDSCDNGRRSGFFLHWGICAFSLKNRFLQCGHLR